MCFVHPIFSIFGFWYFGQLSCVIFFPFFPSCLYCLAKCKQRLCNIFIKWPKMKNGMNIIGSFPTFKIGIRMKNLVFLLRKLYKLTFKDFRSVKAVENCVEHYVRIVAIRIELGTETICVWNDACILSDDKIGSRIFNFSSALSCPCVFLEIIFIAKRLIVVKTII